MKSYNITNTKKHSCPILESRLYHHYYVGKLVEKDKIVEEEEVAYLVTHICLQIGTAQRYT